MNNINDLIASYYTEQTELKLSKLITTLRNTRTHASTTILDQAITEYNKHYITVEQAFHKCILAYYLKYIKTALK